MSEDAGRVLIQDGTVLHGDIRNCSVLHVAGTVEGDVAADEILVISGGRLAGRVCAGAIVVHGEVEAEVIVRGLLKVANGGSVSGEVRYGQLAIDEGGRLEADVRNIPPRLAGDYQIEVARGGIGKITPDDLQAIDPDDPADDLLFTVLHPTRGHIALSGTPATPVDAFTQADIDKGTVVFVHDGSQSSRASFDVICKDAKGGVSGLPQTIRVDVQERDRGTST